MILTFKAVVSHNTYEVVTEVDDPQVAEFNEHFRVHRQQSVAREARHVINSVP